MKTNLVVDIENIPPRLRPRGRKPSKGGPMEILHEVLALPAKKSKLIRCDSPKAANVTRNSVLVAAYRSGSQIATAVRGNDLYVWAEGEGK